MIYKWKILELFAEAKSVDYLAWATDGKNTVEQMGNYIYPDGVVNLPVDQIKEFHLIEWIDKKEIELNLENQLNALNSNNKIEFPWLANTFTPEG
jgi:hypothetical protein